MTPILIISGTLAALCIFRWARIVAGLLAVAVVAYWWWIVENGP